MYPSALPLDRSVIRSRLKRRKELLLSARKSVFLRGVVIALELCGFFFFGSFALFLDSLANFIDLLFSIALIACIRIADRPPDRNHPLGHGRFEPIAGLILGTMLVFLGLLSFFVEGKELFSNMRGKQVEPYAFIIPLVALIFLEVSHRISRRAAKKENSPALFADAIHYRIDALTSVFALISLSFATFFPSRAPFFDHLGAVSIAAFMVVIGVIAARKNIDQLLDKTPSSELFEKVRKAATDVQGVLATEKLHIQAYGPDAFVAIDIEVDPGLTVAYSHQLTQKVRRSIQRHIPSVRDVIVHVEPYFPGDHDIGDPRNG